MNRQYFQVSFDATDPRTKKETNHSYLYIIDNDPFKIEMQREIARHQSNWQGCGCNISNLSITKINPVQLQNGIAEAMLRRC